MFMLASGWDGDIDEQLALAHALVATGNAETIHFFVPRDVAHAVPKDQHFVAHELPFRCSATWRIGSPGGARIRAASFMSVDDASPAVTDAASRAITKLLTPCLPVIVDTITKLRSPEERRRNNSDSSKIVMITSTPFTLVAVTTCEILEIPHIFVLSNTPLARTSDYPAPRSGTSTRSITYGSANGNAWLAGELVAALRHRRRPTIRDDHSLSHITSQRALFGQSLVRLNSMRRKKYGLGILSEGRLVDLLFGGPPVTLLHCFPTALVPRCSDWTSGILSFSTSLDDTYMPPGWRADVQCPRLKTFLDSLNRSTSSNTNSTSNQPQHGSRNTTNSVSKPVCVTLCSPRSVTRRVSARTVLTALHNAGVSSAVFVDIGLSSVSTTTSSASSPTNTKSSTPPLITPPISISSTTSPFSKLSASSTSREPSLRDWIDSSVYMMDYNTKEDVRLPWLLPQCSALLCSGAGRQVFTAMRVGIPIIAAPWLPDDVFWATIIDSSSLGARTKGPTVKVAVPDLERAISTALSRTATEKAAHIGRSIRRRGEGATLAARAIADRIS